MYLFVSPHDTVCPFRIVIKFFEFDAVLFIFHVEDLESAKLSQYLRILLVYKVESSSTESRTTHFYGCQDGLHIHTGDNDVFGICAGLVGHFQISFAVIVVHFF